VIRMKGDHHATTPSSFALADRLPVPEAIQPPSLAVAVGAYVKSVQQMLGHVSAVDARNEASTSRYRRPAARSGLQRSEDTRSAPG
jgi:hypothetical protein